MTYLKSCVSTVVLLACTTASALTPDEARHFQLRTRFAIDPVQQEKLLQLSRREAVRQLIASYRTTSAAAFSAASRTQLRAQWLQRLLASRTPFTERMMQVWLNLFRARFQAGDSVPQMRLRLRMLQSEGVGHYDQLLLAMSRLPEHAHSEGFAGLLLDITLGPDNYSTQDLKTAKSVFAQPDGRAVTALFLESRAAWQPHSLIRTLLSDRRSRERLVQMLWRSFISSDPQPGRVAWLARQFQDSGYRIDTLMRQLLDDPAFWAPANRGQLVKSPLMLLVSAGRSLQLRPGRHIEQWVRLSARWGEPLLTGSWTLTGPRGQGWLAQGRLQLRQRWLIDSSRSPSRMYRHAFNRFNRRVPDAEKAGRLMRTPEALPVVTSSAEYTRALLQLPDFQYY